MITVDLSKEKIDVSPMRADLIRDYIGGEGLGSDSIAISSHFRSSSIML
jgi:aldehyde:ferredoxin oxidoreductase